MIFFFTKKPICAHEAWSVWMEGTFRFFQSGSSSNFNRSIKLLTISITNCALQEGLLSLCHNWALPFFLVGMWIFWSIEHCFEKDNQSLFYWDKHQHNCYNQIQFNISLPRIVKKVLYKGKQWLDNAPTKPYSISSIWLKFEH